MIGLVVLAGVIVSLLVEIFPDPTPPVLQNTWQMYGHQVSVYRRYDGTTFTIMKALPCKTLK